MDKSANTPINVTREERLAARLRDNLRRRKAQARALSDPAAADTPDEDSEAGANAALSKSPPKS